MKFQLKEIGLTNESRCTVEVIISMLYNTLNVLISTYEEDICKCYFNIVTADLG